MTSDTSGPVALALDELLGRTPPADLARLAERLRAAQPAWADQAAAAAAGATAVMTDIAAAGGGVAVPAHPIEVPEWVRLGALTAWSGWVLGQASTCAHSPHPARPQPVLAAAWKPALVVCGACSHLLKLPRNSAADRRCDGCGRVTTGVENGDGIYPSMVGLGPLVFAHGTCRDCLPDRPERTS